ncbi:MAG: methionine--tRNA ligase subunit beta, partial [Dokdonella sp.]
FWPAVLHGAGMRMPTRLHVNGYVTVNGAKMSKSRGTFIMARTWLDVGLDADCLRYYFAAKSSGGVVDIDLNLEDFAQRVNADLVGKFVNIASRCAKLLETHFDGELAEAFWNKDTPSAAEKTAMDLLAAISERLLAATALYESDEYSKAITSIMACADQANAYIADAAPWAVAKDDSRHDELHVILSTGINLFRAIACALKPVLPATVARAEIFLSLPTGGFDSFASIPLHLSNHRVQPYQALLTRIDPVKIAAMIEASKESLQAVAEAPTTAANPAIVAAAPATSPTSSDAPATISIDDFAKLDLRVASVLECEFVEGSDKLLRFRLDAGDLGERQIFSGIRAAYADPASLVGRQVVFIANLAPRKMRFGMSEGMILSAGTGGDDLFLLDVDAGAMAGATVR